MASTAVSMSDLDGSAESASAAGDDDALLQSVMDRCADLGMPSSVEDSIAHWIDAGPNSAEWISFIKSQVHEICKLSSMTAPSFSSAAAFPTELQQLLRALHYQPAFSSSSSQPSLHNRDARIDITDFLLCELQCCRMLATQPGDVSSAQQDGDDKQQLQLKSAVLSLCSLLRIPIPPPPARLSVPALLSAMPAAIASLSASHPSLSSSPVLSPSSLSPAQHALLASHIPALSSSLTSSLSLFVSRFSLLSSLLSDASLPIPEVELRPYDAWGLTAEMLSEEQAGRGGRTGTERKRQHGEVGLQGVHDRGGRVGQRGGGGGGGGRRGRGGGGGPQRQRGRGGASNEEGFEEFDADAELERVVDGRGEAEGKAELGIEDERVHRQEEKGGSRRKERQQRAKGDAAAAAAAADGGGGDEAAGESTAGWTAAEPRHKKKKRQKKKGRQSAAAAAAAGGGLSSA